MGGPRAATRGAGLHAQRWRVWRGAAPPCRHHMYVTSLAPLPACAACRVKIVDKRARGGKLYLKKGTVVDVKTPTGAASAAHMLCPAAACTAACVCGKRLQAWGAGRERTQHTGARVPPLPALRSSPAFRPTLSCLRRPSPHSVCDVYIDGLNQSVQVGGLAAAAGLAPVGRPGAAAAALTWCCPLHTGMSTSLPAIPPATCLHRWSLVYPSLHTFWVCRTCSRASSRRWCRRQRAPSCWCWRDRSAASRAACSNATQVGVGAGAGDLPRRRLRRQGRRRRRRGWQQGRHTTVWLNPAVLNMLCPCCPAPRCRDRPGGGAADGRFLAAQAVARRRVGIRWAARRLGGCVRRCCPALPAFLHYWRPLTPHAPCVTRGREVLNRAGGRRGASVVGAGEKRERGGGRGKTCARGPDIASRQAGGKMACRGASLKVR